MFQLHVHHFASTLFLSRTASFVVSFWVFLNTFLMILSPDWNLKSLLIEKLMKLLLLPVLLSYFLIYYYHIKNSECILVVFFVRKKICTFEHVTLFPFILSKFQAGSIVCYHWCVMWPTICCSVYVFCEFLNFLWNCMSLNTDL